MTNGYCAGGCAERRAETAEQTRQVARPEPVAGAEAAPMRPAVAGGRPGGAPLRVVR
ncbi:hypothetical protein [Nonomuraea sp. 10N515B]|uniref:hypothetical protein n=1 Tax=Nonomuraea sp. 10N515B TaxID=3457422 RepID=UPI003FCD3058